MNRPMVKTALFLALFFLTFLGCGRNNDENLSSLVQELLLNKEEKIRNEAVDKIVNLKQKGIPVLVASLKEKKDPARSTTLIALNRLGKHAIKDLLKGIESPEPRIRAGVLVALGWPDALFVRGFTPEEDKLILPQIIKALRDEDPTVRSAAAEALASVSVGSKNLTEGTTALKGVLEDSNVEVRIRACRSLRAICKELRDDEALKTIVRPLVNLLHDKDASVRSAALQVFQEIGEIGEQAAQDLVRALTDDDSKVQTQAYFAIRKLGLARKTAFPFLVKMLVDAKDESHRYQAVWTLSAVGPLNKEMLPALIFALRDESERIRKAAAYTIGEVEPKPKEASVVLEKVLREGELGTQITVSWTLWRINQEPRQVIPVLMKGLRSKDAQVRESAAGWLGDIGPAAKDAVRELTQVSENDVDENIRAIASTSLQKIKSKK